MNRLATIALGACAALVAFSMGAAAQQSSSMSFFITSVNPGKGGDFGGLEGADRYCQSLATAAGAGSKTWRAYLSSSAAGGATPVNARDRIGAGPWVNAKGVTVAKDVNELHGTNNIGKDTALSEKGEKINGRGDTPNVHDILTGSTADGRAISDRELTCANWTSSTTGNAMVGHHDRVGLRDDDASRSWNASHPSRDCTLEGLRATGGGGLIYCFAAN